MPSDPRQEQTEAAAAKREETARRKAVIEQQQTDLQRWSNPAQLEAAWDARAEAAARFVPAGTRVLDVGCGRMALEAMLPMGCTYQPCDLVARDPRTLVCDLNAGPLPAAAVADADRVMLLGVLEYLYDPTPLLRHLAAAGKTVIASYCASDWTRHLDRRALGWVNDFSLEDIQRLMIGAGLSVRSGERVDTLQALFLLDPHWQPARPRKRVLVLSYANCGNFGDRLGVHLLNAVLPADVEVFHGHFEPWTIPEGDFDLLILGIGNSLFRPLLTDRLIALIDRIPRRIGIFGTQYRADMPTRELAEVIARLDHWFARYREDLDLYARGRANASHLGDWLIQAFPMTRGHRDRLTINLKDTLNLPLDRAIQQIQSYRQVYSARLHPLLGALASAEQVAYREQPAAGYSSVSGKFRSMLIDVFGRSFKEDVMFPVDRNAVCTYKLDVDRRVAGMAATLRELLA